MAEDCGPLPRIVRSHPPSSDDAATAPVANQRLTAGNECGGGIESRLADCCATSDAGAAIVNSASAAPNAAPRVRRLTPRIRRVQTGPLLSERSAPRTPAP